MPKLNNKLVQVLLHAGLWFCLFFYPFLFHYLPLNDSFAVFRVALFLALLSVFFYSNTLLLIPRFLAHRRFILYFSIVIAAITIIALFSGCLERCFNPHVAKDPLLIYTARVTGMVASFLVWVISSLVKITGEWFRTQQSHKSIEHEKLQAELSFLKTQINPHFLFNALNNIYSLENKRSPLTGEAILRLSELARYMLYETSVPSISLDKEVAYLHNYIELQKLGLAIDVKFVLTGNTQGKNIEPLLLIPLVENAFKHGVSYKKKEPIMIELSVQDDILTLHVENGLPAPDKSKTNGIGLVNLRKRLEALYPGTYSLITGVKGSLYIAELKLKLKHD